MTGIIISGNCKSLNQWVLRSFWLISFLVWNVSSYGQSCPGSLTVNNSSVSVSDATCSSSDGSISGLSVTGGIAPLTYNWTDGSGNLVGSSINLSAVGYGVYTFAVTDGNGCIETSGPYTINAPGGIGVSLTSADATCSPNCDGSASVSASGGNPPYTYTWSGGQTSTAVNGLCSGNYSVTVSDNGCSPSGVELVTNGGFDLGNSGFTSSYYFCNSSNCLNTEGGYGIGYNSQFFNGGFQGYPPTLCPSNCDFLVVNGSSTPNASIWCQTIAISPNTTYEFSTWITSIHTSNPAILQFSINGVTIGSSFNAPGSLNTWLQFFEIWNSGSNTSATICIVNQNTNTSGNDFGLDDISFQECISSCPSVYAVAIQEYAAFSLSLSGTGPSCNGFNNGLITATTTGGSSPYSAVWNNSVTQTTLSVTGLNAGSYNVTVTDANGCTSSDNYSLSEPSAISLSLSSTQSNCGQANGAVAVTTSGGTGSWTYLWDDPGPSTSDTANGLSAGSYNVTVTDANGCIQTGSTTVSNQGGGTASITANNMVLCHGDSIGDATVTMAGGSTPYSYAWNTTPVQTNPLATGLSAGIYIATVTDAIGCIDTAGIIITEPPVLSANITASNNITCNNACDGSATVTSSGGSGSHTYLWSDGQSTTTASTLCDGMYGITVTDGNNCANQDTITLSEPSALTSTAALTHIVCNGDGNGAIDLTSSGGIPGYTYNWMPGALTSEDLTGIAGGTFAVTVTDNNGCTDTLSAIINEPTALGIITSSLDASCGGSDGQAGVIISGGISPYTYLWNDPGGQSTPTAISLTSQSYTVTITDANGCIDSTNIYVSEVNGPVIDSINSTDITCFGDNNGTASVYASGGFLPYVFTWDDPLNQSSANASNLPGGTWNVTLTDQAGCDTISSVTIYESSGMALSINGTASICFGQSTSFTASANGGAMPYTYVWDNGLPPDTAQSLSPLTSTTFTLTLTDSSGCSIQDSISVNVSLPINVNVSDTNVCQGNMVELSTIPSQGNGGPYSYLWLDDGSTGDSLVVSPSDTMVYLLQISDGCSDSVVVSITVNANPNPTADFTALCFPDSFSLQFYDSTTIANDVITSWSWDFGDNQTSSSPQPNHAYGSTNTYDVSLAVISSGGCADTITKTITSPPTAGFGMSTHSTSTSNPAVFFVDSSSVSASSWLWNFDDPASNASNLDMNTNTSHVFNNPGDYNILLTVMDANGCMDTALQHLEVISAYSIFVPNAFTPDGNGLNDHFIPEGVLTDNQSFEMLIFNRWGDLIFSTDNLNNPWMGTGNGGKDLVPVGVYVWVINTMDANSKRHQYRGHVTIIK